MARFQRLLYLGFLFVPLTSHFSLLTSAGAQAPVVGDATKGRAALLEYNCAWCHGTEGQGGLALVGPRIARVPRSVDSFIAYVRKPANRMSAYSEASISDAVLRDIYAYLRSLPEPTPAADVPLLDQLRRPGR